MSANNNKVEDTDLFIGQLPAQLKHYNKKRYLISELVLLGRTLYDFQPEDTNYEYFRFKAGEYFVQTRQITEHWLWAEQAQDDGSLKQGIFPSTFVQYVHVVEKPDKTLQVRKEEYVDYANQFKVMCVTCKKSLGHLQNRHHCIECGDNFESFNLCSDCYTNYSHEQHEKQFKHKPVFLPMNTYPDIPFFISCGTSVAECLQKAFMLYSERPCLGYRKRNPTTKELDMFFSWVTYKEVFSRAFNLGKGILNMLPLVAPNKRGMIGICCLNRVEWFISDWACLLHGMVTVPVLRTKMLEQDLTEVQHMINNAELQIIVTAKQFTSKFCKLAANCPTLKVLIEIDDDNYIEDVREADTVIPQGLHVLPMKQVEAKGQLNPINYVSPVAPTDLLTIVYTSGSTGVPKGAIITDANFRKSMTQPYYTYHPLVMITTAPLAHMADRLSANACVVNGGRMGIFSGDVQATLFEDIQLVKPIMLSSTPRLFDRLFHEYQKKKAVLQAQNLPIVEEDLYHEIRNYLGGRVTAITVGGAATSETVLDFIKKCFSKSAVCNGYASTEAGSIAWVSSTITDQKLMDNVQVKLVDVPEMGYFAKDRRGEIWVKSPTLIPGYYRNEEKTNESFNEGWFMTGDIGEMDETGRVKIIDRKKSIFKMAQGEYVSPTVLENLYLKSEYIDQIFIHGEDSHAFLLAVVVPNEAIIRTATGLQDLPVQELYKQDVVTEIIIKDIQRIGLESKKLSYEIPMGLLLEHIKFTEENALLTGTQKLCRHRLIKHYRSAMDAKFAAIEGKQQQSQFQQLLKEALGLTSSNDKSFVEIGGDSLAAAKISLILEQQGVKLKPSQLLNKNMTMAELEKYVQAQKDGTAPKDQADFDIEKEVTSLLSTLPPLNHSLPMTPVSQVKHVLLTGATGFLGAHLLARLLQHPQQLVVHCIVRGSKTDDPRTKLMKQLQEMNIIVDPAMNARVLVHTGDLGKPNLGIDSDMWNWLAAMIDVIYHNGANVNFQLDYDQLKPENVLSTMELLKLSVLGTKLKPLFFVSTMSVFNFTSVPRHEDAELLPLVTGQFEALGGGYSQSKLITECVIQQARKVLNYPHLSVFRTQMIGGHSITGAMNTSDWIYRVFVGCLQVGLAPQSTAPVLTASVDYVSNAIVYISLHEGVASLAHGKAFYLANLNKQGYAITMNLLFETAQKLGIGVNILQHASWFASMQTAMNNPEYKQNPLFPVLNMFIHGVFGNTDAQLQFPFSNTTSMLLQSNIACPINDNTYISKWIQWLVQSKRVVPKSATQMLHPIQQPIVQQPIVQQPMVKQPIVQQPIVQQPIVQQPIVQQPPLGQSMSKPQNNALDGDW